VAMAESMVKADKDPYEGYSSYYQYLPEMFRQKKKNLIEIL